ncbi:hypothetical protein ACIRPT_38435 [Streptomyces sp. NPDC101227]|uniref:hypothetical protein n=1 Tax=Streptomyces sp. NPDC101227 TaxID=3366136 RepID=UPI0037F6317E
MPRHSITVTAYHPDRTVCPSDHRYTTSGKPLTEGCTGRTMFLATCSCKKWTGNPSSTKNYATEMGRRHRGSQHQAKSPTSAHGPAALRELLQFDAD